jgi:dTDP-4-dehydrorhamnose reductase
MLGLDVCSAAAAAGHEPLAFPRAELDITDEAAVRTTVARLQPDAVINCAAWTDVDGAESAYDAALAVNGAGAANVARAAAANGAWTVHVSTDYVFDGAKPDPYVESDPVAPMSAYGRSKLEGERAVAASAPDAHTMVRSSWLFGAGGPCFPATILRLAAERGELTVVDDQVGCPTFTGHLAQALVRLAAGPRVGGILHVAGGGGCSWFQFATEIVARSGADCVVKPGRSADLDRPAPRPANSVLRSERETAPRLADWSEGLSEYLLARVPVS